jgi:hypothetical protein
MRLKQLLLLLIVSLILFGCNKSENVVEADTTYRSYYLGYTPFPYSISSDALVYAYQKIAEETDIVLHHFDGGIPWNEALMDTDFHPNITADWQYRLFNTPPKNKIFLAVTPISFLRDGLAHYRSESEDMPLPAPWDTISFNHLDVKLAFYNYCKRIINFFNPDYFAMGIEVNLLMANNKPLWDKYLDLQKTVYLELKQDYPQLPIFVTQTGMDLIGGYTGANFTDQVTAFNQAINYSDYLALSAHTFLTTLNTDSIPDAIFDKMFSLSNKPLVISETSYPAESFSVYGGSITFNGTQEKQYEFFNKLFDKAEEYNCKFIINFVIRDYDLLWLQVGSPDDLAKLWKDTGIYDGDGNARLVRSLWLDKLKTKHK